MGCLGLQRLPRKLSELLVIWRFVSVATLFRAWSFWWDGLVAPPKNS